MTSRSIVILGQTWKVKVRKKHPDLEGCMGRTDFSKNTIYISREIPELTQRSTLLHEILHILSYCLGVRLQENEIMRFEAGLFSTIHDNKLRF